MSYPLTEIKSLVHNLYNMEGEVKQLPGELDLNYLITHKDGKKYTFKIANINEKRENLEFQNAFMLHLLAKQLGLEIPEVIFSTNGELITLVKDNSGKDRMARLLSWVEGRPLATVNPHTDDLLFNLGNLCGKLSMA